MAKLKNGTYSEKILAVKKLQLNSWLRAAAEKMFEQRMKKTDSNSG